VAYGSDIPGEIIVKQAAATALRGSSSQQLLRQTNVQQEL